MLVDVWADWCGPCKSFAPVFEQAAGQLAGKCRLAKLDSEANQQLSAQLGIRSIPSLILFKNGREVARQSGAFPLPQLMSWLRSQGHLTQIQTDLCATCRGVIKRFPSRLCSSTNCCVSLCRGSRWISGVLA
jgi:thioredoxin